MIARSGASVLIVADRFLGADRFAALRTAANDAVTEAAQPLRSTAQAPVTKITQQPNDSPWPARSPGSCGSWSACRCLTPRNPAPAATRKTG